jgi:hypothetical protein
MVAPIKFLSGRQQQQKIGVLDSTENIKVLEVIGRAGIGTTIFEPSKQLDVRGDVFVSGPLTIGSTTSGEDFSIANLTVSGVSTFTGIATFANNIDANGNLDVDGHTELDNLNVSGVSTFNDESFFKNNVYFRDGDIHFYGQTSGEDLHWDTSDGSLVANDNTTFAAGTGKDLSIYHNGTNSYIDNQGANTGDLYIRNFQTNNKNIYIQADDSRDSIVLNYDSSVDLYYNGSKKFETTGIGISVLNGTDDTATITGPSNLIIDPMPVGVGTTSGVVRIKGDLFVDGTQTQINSTTIELADFIVGIATTATTDLLADGAGIGIATNKFFTFDNSNTAFKSTENLNLETGHTYKINGTDVLSSDTLGSGVVNSSLTNLGTLDGLNVNGNSQFNSIDVLANATFSALVDINNGAEISTLKVEDLTENRVVIVGTDGELEDDANFTFDGSQLALGVGLTVTGIATFANNIDANGGLDVDGLSDLDELNVTGLSTFGSNVDINAGLDVSGVSTFQGNVNLGDNDRLRFGDSQDLEIYHDGNNSYIREGGAGALRVGSSRFEVRNPGDNKTSISAYPAGEVELYYDNSKKFETTGYGVTVIGGLNVSGISTFQGDVNLLDNDKLLFGDGGFEFQIYHDGFKSVIRDNGPGDLYIGSNGGAVRINSGISQESIAVFNKDGSVELYYDNSKKFETTDGGIDVTGHTETDTLRVSGITTLGVTTATDLTSQQLNVSGISTLGVTTATDLTSQQLNVSGISTLGTVKISSGIVTATSGVVTYYGDGTNLTLTNSVALSEESR